MFRRTSSSRPHAPRRSAPRRANAPRTSRSRPARRARLLTRRAKLNAARRPRRGVLLLVVLSLLVLFLMVGMAFVVTAKQSEKAAKSSMKAAVRISGEAAQADLLDEVLMQIVRDTNNPNSSLRFHSLLGDMYGNDGLKGVIGPSATMTTLLPPKFAGSASGGADPGPTGGQMIEFQIGTAAFGATGSELLRDFHGNVVDGANANLTFSNIENAYNGQVLTFVNGVAKGRSTRIVGFIPPNTFRVMNFQLADGSLISNPATQLATAQVLINGRPFSGTGAGLNANAADDQPKLTARETVAGIQVDEDGGGTRDPLIALMPNAVFFNPDSTTIETGQSDVANGVINYLPAYNANIGGFADWNGRGGANESYDAVDFQNMFLGFVSDEANRKEFEDPSNTSPDLDEVGVPSFHRPDLLYWWRGRFPATGPDALANKPMLLRKIMMRPNWYDHRGFTGSNPEIAQFVGAFRQAVENNDAAQIEAQSENLLLRSMLGPWDVDNDNDGYRDSVWVDVGLPVMAGPNGKLVKPFAAILCLDMDGRLQANSHGTCDLANAWGTTTGLTAMANPGVQLNRTGTTADAAPHGVGYGPAEISLGSIVDAGRFQRLLIGDVGTGGSVVGRYGYPQGTVAPGYPQQFDILSQVSLNGLPNTPDGVVNGQLSTSFTLPPDLRARYGMALNRYGQPVWEADLQNEAREPYAQLVIDSPYELNLSAATAAGLQGAAAASAPDAPYSPAELERLLRMYDADAGTLPGRLTEGVLQVSGLSLQEREQLRQRLAVDAFDLPVPSVALPHEMSGLLSVNPAYRREPKSTAELFEIRVRAALHRQDAALYPLFPEPIVNANAAITVRGIMRRILAPELANGLRLNVNRPLGSGRDTNGNGVVDEPGEAGQIWNVPAGNAAKFNEPYFPPMASEIVPAANPTGNPEGQRVDVDHRHLLARHLYTLTLTLIAPENYCASATPTEIDLELARRVAQWAVNVVDFRDADNIMTPFEYDVNPFDGWDVDGIIGQNSPDDSDTTTRGLVWGTEKPELVMTETLAWHDRRTDDLPRAYTFPDGSRDTQMADPADPAADPNADKDFDQQYRPQGALFVEIHNPWPASPAVNEDTHAVSDASGVRSDLGVDLGKTHNNQPTGSPVWRIAAYKRWNATVENAANWDPDSHEAASNNQPSSAFPLRKPTQQIDRSIYFSGPRAAFPGDSPAFFNDASEPVPPVRPGRLLVVGPGNLRDAASGVHKTQIGDRKRDFPGPLRRIELRVNNGLEVNLREGRTAKLTSQADSVRTVDANDDVIRDTSDNANYDMTSATEAGRLAHEKAFNGDPSASAADVAIIRKASAATTGQPVDQASITDRPLSISEPAAGYPDSFLASRWSETDQIYKDANGQLMPIDVPLDGPIGGEAALENQFGPLEGRVGPNERTNWPRYLLRYNAAARRWDSNVDPVLTQIRTAGATEDIGASYGFLYLQRLANPLLPWNPEPGHPNHDANRPVNPYFTVDNMSVNMTVFNSRGKDPNGAEENGTTSNSAGGRFASYERGYKDPANPQQGANPSNMAYQFPAGIRRSNSPMMSLPETSRNRLRSAPLDSTFAFKFNQIPFHTLGMLNRSFQNLNPTENPPLSENDKKSEPSKPFEWLTWNNRPFVSGSELMLVPRARSSELFRRYATADRSTPTPNWPFSVNEDDDRQKPNQLPPFNHLENFFAGEPAVNGVPIHLYRVLQYVHVPSLFAGTSTWLNPSRAAPQEFFGAELAQMSGPLDPRLPYQAPFNSISEFRDPGRVNINTMMSEQVYKGLFHDHSGAVAHANPGWDEFVKSLRNDTNPEPFRFNSSNPAFVANPFRSPDAGDLVPLNSMRHAGVDCTLQRSVTPPPASAGGHANPGDNSLMANMTTVAGHNDWKRNPYFFLQPMVRLDNLVTNRSNTFAVWVTIGFFEVEDAPAYNDFRTNNGNLPDDAATKALYNRVYPDGYTFGREDGVDVGNVRRLRGFYMIDRTKMAGYEPGADHNVEEVIRLRRRIE